MTKIIMTNQNRIEFTENEPYIQLSRMFAGSRDIELALIDPENRSSQAIYLRATDVKELRYSLKAMEGMLK